MPLPLRNNFLWTKWVGLIGGEDSVEFSVLGEGGGNSLHFTGAANSDFGLNCELSPCSLKSCLKWLFGSR